MADVFLYSVRGPKTWVTLTSQELADKRTEIDVCLVPVGAVEPRAGHLPLGQDNFQAEEIVRRALLKLEADGKKAIIGATLPFGPVSNLKFPGSVNITPTTPADALVVIGNRNPRFHPGADALVKRGVVKSAAQPQHLAKTAVRGQGEPRPAFEDLEHRPGVAGGGGGIGLHFCCIVVSSLSDSYHRFCKYAGGSRIPVRAKLFSGFSVSDLVARHPGRGISVPGPWISVAGLLADDAGRGILGIGPGVRPWRRAGFDGSGGTG